MSEYDMRKLAEQYVYENGITPSESYYENKRVIEVEDILPILQWLSKDYCIVPKVEILNQHAWYMQRMKEVSSNRQMNRGKAIALEYLFGKEMFEEDKK